MQSAATGRRPSRASPTPRRAKRKRPRGQAVDRSRGRAPPRGGRAARRLPLGRHRLDDHRRRDGPAARIKVKTFSIGFSGDASLRRDALRPHRGRARSGPSTPSSRSSRSSFELVEKLVALPRRSLRRLVGDPHVGRLAASPAEHVTVALTGDGGDELFCGYTRFLAAEAVESVPFLGASARASRGCASLPRDGRERSLLSRVHRLLGSANAPLARRLTELIPLFAASLPEVLRPEVRAHRRRRCAAGVRRSHARAQRRARPRSRACSSTTSRPTCPTTSW